MVTHYVDIKILPDPEFSHAHLMAALYSKLHRALVQLRTNDIGVSFPEYTMSPRGLGQVLRLHSKETSLQGLLSTDWLRGMLDHTELTPVLPVPASASHRQLTRKQFKTSAERLRRRRMRRKGETEEQVRKAIPDSVEQMPKLPYIRIRSQSTGRCFQLFLSLSDPLERSREGGFNSYGLSTMTTVPWF